MVNMLRPSPLPTGPLPTGRQAVPTEGGAGRGRRRGERAKRDRQVII